MTYIVELSFDLCKNKNVSEIKELLSFLAEKYNSITHYFTHEVEGKGRIIDINDCIHTISFDDNSTDLLNYIKKINKLKFIKIDCIYSDKDEINLIYTSKKYLSKNIVFVDMHSVKPKLNEFNSKILKLIK